MVHPSKAANFGTENQTSKRRRVVCLDPGCNEILWMVPKGIEKLGNVFNMYRHRINTNVHSLDRKHIYSYLTYSYFLCSSVVHHDTGREKEHLRPLVHDLMLRATIDGIDLIMHNTLGGGFKYCFFHPYLGKWSNLTNIFQMGWFNHQLAHLESPKTTCCSICFVDISASVPARCCVDSKAVGGTLRLGSLKVGAV